MNRTIKIIALILSSIFVFSCNNNKDEESPYEEILSRPPFAVLSDSIKKEPGNDGLFFRRAVLLNTNNFPEPALADFKKAWSLKKEEQYALAIGTLLLEKKPDSAVLFLNNALNELPNSFLLRLTLARGYAAQNKTDEALKICNYILQQNPQQVDVLKLKADLLDKKGNKDEATSLLESAYNITPFDIELNYILALRYAESKNAKLIALTDSLIRADTENAHAEPYYYKGIYYSNMGDKTKAIQQFDEAVKQDYNFLDAYIEKGSILYEMRRYDDAMAVFNLALTISPQFADSYYWIAKCQEAKGQKEEARVNYLRAFQLDKTLTEARTAAEKLAN